MSMPFTKEEIKEDCGHQIGHCINPECGAIEHYIKEDRENVKCNECGKMTMCSSEVILERRLV